MHKIDILEKRLNNVEIAITGVAATVFQNEDIKEVRQMVDMILKDMLLLNSNLGAEFDMKKFQIEAAEVQAKKKEALK